MEVPRISASACDRTSSSALAWARSSRPSSTAFCFSTSRRESTNSVTSSTLIWLMGFMVWSHTSELPSVQVESSTSARGSRTVKVCAASSTSTVIWPASLMPAVTFPS